MVNSVSLLLTNEAYRNDVAEEIRLFLGNIPIVPDADNADFVIKVALTREGDTLLASASSGESVAEFQTALPAADALTVKRHEKRAVKIAAFRLMKKLFPTPMPWGSLTGIRPTKLFRELVEDGGEAYAREMFLDTFDVTPEKTSLCETTCREQAEAIASAGARTIDLYFGVPYCKTRCLYCSFGTELAKSGAVLDGYLAALMRDIELSAGVVRDAAKSIRASYFGGGTPSILSAKQTERLLKAAVSAYGGLGRECTFEAGRPDTITAEKLSVLRDYGIRRISINPQTMNDATLYRIGRLHTAREIEKTYLLARNMGFTDINMDLIIGLPGETEKDVANSVSRVLSLSPENVTVHTLCIKRSSRLKAQLEKYPMVPAAEAESMVRICRTFCEQAGLYPYYLYRQKYMQGNLENVGYAKRGTLCLYNVDIMEETESIMAHGAGAISKRVYGVGRRIERVPNPKDVPTYLAKIPSLIASKKALFLD